MHVDGKTCETIWNCPTCYLAWKREMGEVVGNIAVNVKTCPKKTLDPFIRTSLYIKLMRWARLRYTKNGELIVSHNGEPSVYTRIEKLAYKRYLE